MLINTHAFADILYGFRCEFWEQEVNVFENIRHLFVRSEEEIFQDQFDV